MRVFQWAGREHQLFSQLESQYGPEDFDRGSWTVCQNRNIHGAGNAERVQNWKRRFTIEQLKAMAVEKGYTAFWVTKPGFLMPK